MARWGVSWLTAISEDGPGQQLPGLARQTIQDLGLQRLQVKWLILVDFWSEQGSGRANYVYQTPSNAVQCCAIPTRVTRLLAENPLLPTDGVCALLRQCRSRYVGKAGTIYDSSSRSSLHRSRKR